MLTGQCLAEIGKHEKGTLKIENSIFKLSKGNFIFIVCCSLAYELCANQMQSQ